jgi:sulfur-carrier protein
MIDQNVQVTVKLFASFRLGRFVEARRQYSRDTRIADVIGQLDIALKDIGMIMVDGRHAEPEDVLRDGTKLALFPLLGGG